MSKVVAVHSFRRGTGKSVITLNLATILAAEGKRVAIVDSNIQSPVIHTLANLDEARISFTLNDYLLGKCDISQTVYDVTKRIPEGVTGQLFVIPAEDDPAKTAFLLRTGYDVAALHEGLRTLRQGLELDYLFVDMQAGLNEETLPAIAISHTLIEVLSHDQRDYQGTSVVVEVARKLGVPRITLAVNEMPDIFDHAGVVAQMNEKYGSEVLAILPYSEEMATLAGTEIFCLRYPDHAITQALKTAANGL